MSYQHLNNIYIFIKCMINYPKEFERLNLLFVITFKSMALTTDTEIIINVNV